MQFVVKRTFRWGELGRLLPGEILELEESHPRLDGLFEGRYIGYSNIADVPMVPYGEVARAYVPDDVRQRMLAASELIRDQEREAARPKRRRAAATA